MKNTPMVLSMPVAARPVLGERECPDPEQRGEDTERHDQPYGLLTAAARPVERP